MNNYNNKNKIIENNTKKYYDNRTTSVFSSPVLFKKQYPYICNSFRHNAHKYLTFLDSLCKNYTAVLPTDKTMYTL